MESIWIFSRICLEVKVHRIRIIPPQNTIKPWRPKAKPSPSNPKMAELCNHTAQASSHHACAKDGCLNVTICQILMEIFGGIGGCFFCCFWGWQTSDTQLTRWKLGKKIHPNHGSRCHPTASMVPLPQYHHIPRASNTLHYNYMSLKLGLIIVISISLTIHCGTSMSVVGCVLFCLHRNT